MLFTFRFRSWDNCAADNLFERFHDAFLGRTERIGLSLRRIVKLRFFLLYRLLRLLSPQQCLVDPALINIVN